MHVIYVLWNGLTAILYDNTMVYIIYQDVNHTIILRKIYSKTPVVFFVFQSNSRFYSDTFYNKKIFSFLSEHLWTVIKKMT